MRPVVLATVIPGLEARTPGTPWAVGCKFRVSPFKPPIVTYPVLYGGKEVTSASDEWCPLPPGPAVVLVERMKIVQSEYTTSEAPARASTRASLSISARHWIRHDILEYLLERFRIREAPAPPLDRLHAFLAESRRLLMEAHLARVAEQLSDEFSSEDVSRIWGEEDVRRVMES